MDETLSWAGMHMNAATAWPCLDFVNTVEWRLSARNEYLRDYTEVVQWVRYTALCSEREAYALLAEAARRPADALASYGAAIALRETLYTVVSAVARRSRPPRVALERLNAAVTNALVPVRLVPTDGHFQQQWLDPTDRLDWFLNPVARSAAALLTSSTVARLKECPGGPGKACGFVFVDETKNDSRRWCSGASCGNRARLHRHYTKRRPEAGNRTQSNE